MKEYENFYNWFHEFKTELRQKGYMNYIEYHTGECYWENNENPQYAAEKFIEEKKNYEKLF